MLAERPVELLALALVMSVLVWPRPAAAGPAETDRARQFLARHDGTVRPLEIATGLAWWDANTSGKDEDFARKEAAQNRLDAALADADAFREIKALKSISDAKQIDDPVLDRAVRVLYLQYLEKQVDPELLRQINAIANKVEKNFNVFRAKVDGEELSDSQVRDVLKRSTHTQRRRAVWEASKGVGPAVEGDLKQLAKLRNAAASKLGFANYHALQLFLSEQDGAALVQLFDDLDALTAEPFRKAKADIDGRLARSYGVSVDALMPWHYHDPFFQEAPAVYANLDEPFGKADITAICRGFYAGIGLPIDDVLARSDLYERKGKSPHAFCTDIDREGDVRVLANIVPNEYWMGTMLHELGHAVYSSKNIPAALPYPLRAEAHILATEGVAMLFERFSKQRPFLELMGLAVADPNGFDDAAAATRRNQLLIFSRWCQVMLRFEKSMYENPAQDLNRLWWDLVEKYQGLKRPAGRHSPDYASKIHIVSAPVYYHNYMMGQLFASQVHHAIARDVFGGKNPETVLYNDNPKVGDFMKRRVFEPGRRLPWNALTKHATGEELNPKAFAADLKQ